MNGKENSSGKPLKISAKITIFDERIIEKS